MFFLVERTLNGLRVKECVHVLYRFELKLDVRLLLPDLFKCLHNTSERVNIFSRLINLDLDVLNLFKEGIKSNFCLFVEFSIEDFFPIVDLLDQRVLDVFSLEGKCSNLMGVINHVNLPGLGIEIVEFCFEVFKLWILRFEFFESILRFLFPKPLVYCKFIKELSNFVFGALDRACEQQNDFDNFLVFSNPVVEWLTLILCDFLLVPVLHLLRGLKHMRGGFIDGSLHFL